MENENTPSVDFEKIEGEYLMALERQQVKDEENLVALKNRVTWAATKIQTFWRANQRIYKDKCCRAIGDWWRKIRRKLGWEKAILVRFRHNYYQGVLREGVRRLVLRKKGRECGVKGTIKMLETHRVIIPCLKQTLILQNSLLSEMKYMSNLRLHNEITFRRQWQDYEKNLRTFIESYIKKRWIKNKEEYLDEKGKPRDKDKFIRAQVAKVFDTKFDTLQRNQGELSAAIRRLEQVFKGIEVRYWTRLGVLIQRTPVNR